MGGPKPWRNLLRSNLKWCEKIERGLLPPFLCELTCYSCLRHLGPLNRMSPAGQVAPNRQHVNRWHCSTVAEANCRSRASGHGLRPFPALSF
jgi:hypothetical protein